MIGRVPRYFPTQSRRILCIRAPHFPVPCREESKERRNARWHTTLLAKSSVLHLGSGRCGKGAARGSGKHLFCGRRMCGWAWQLTVFATQRRLAEEPMVYVLPSCRSSVSPMRCRANDQRLCLPRLPASVPGFSIAVL